MVGNTTDTSVGYAAASTQRVTADDGIEYAYRDVGESDVPLVLLQHFRGNLDNWDPALVDALAADRRVVAFDNVGVAATTGTTPNTIEAMAHGAIALFEAIDVNRVDLLGFSIGSFVAQEIALIRPDLLRRVVLASSAPQGASGMHGCMRPSDTEQRHENVVCARVLSDGVNRPSWRLQPRPARLPLVTTRTTKHPALIPHEIPAGARQSPRHDPQSRELDVSPTLATEDKHACGRSGGSRSLRD